MEEANRQAAILTDIQLREKELAVAEIFRSSTRAVLTDKIVAFLEAKYPDEVEAFQEMERKTLQLNFLLTKELDPPLTASVIRSWARGLESGPVGGGDEKNVAPRKGLAELNSEELKSRLEGDGAPSSLVTALVECNFTGRLLKYLDPSDMDDLSGGNVGVKAWLKAYLAAELPAVFSPPPPVNVASSGVGVSPSALDRLLSAVRDGDLSAARMLIGSVESKNTVSSPALEGDGDELSGRISQLLEQKAVTDRAGAQRDLLHKRRRDELDRKPAEIKTGLFPTLGTASPPPPSINATGDFLPVSSDTVKTGEELVMDSMRNLKTTNKFDAAHGLRMAAEGFELDHPSVTLPVPEGLDQSLAKIDNAERTLKRKSALTYQRVTDFSHARSVMRAAELAPLEYGYLALGAIHLAVNDAKGFQRYFQPGLYGEALPDVVRQVIARNARLRLEYITMRGNIEHIVQSSKRPLVVGGSVPARPAARGDGGGRPAQSSVANWPVHKQCIQANPHNLDSVVPRYALVKIFRGRQEYLKSKRQLPVGFSLCRHCALYHRPGEVCPLQILPAHRPESFKKMYQEAVSQGVIKIPPPEEWNSRSGRLAQHRCAPDGKAVTNPDWKHLRSGQTGGPP